MHVSSIVTIPPYADYVEDVARHPIVSGLRLNTVMPVKESYAEVLKRLRGHGVPLWVDLKGRQLRVVGAAIPPYTSVQISHSIKVHTPCDAFFSDGQEHVRVMAVDEDRLILADGPRRLIGPGESVNIVDPSLVIQGTLTKTDKAYLEAMREISETRVMLSYVESLDDIMEVTNFLPDAEIVAKIESQRGVDFVRYNDMRTSRLMAARGDLYVEVLHPHRIVRALHAIIKADPGAIVASRLFDSIARFPVPECPDIMDAAFLMSMGYRTFMLGDAVCLQRDTVLEALNLLQAIAEDMP